MLAELEEVQGRYNDFFKKALEEETGVSVEEASVPASNRIKRESASNLSVLDDEEA